ncbi:hypothetical protein B0H15DRAFT_957262 [Mycena belliarum]|uniref:Uncharacterized protein n=1 Tax=Mycena belliarum TaxID=1033014 RepID=A0AAD6TQ75_9AGAR|nr:hypothetical protein B0H15DRAFT_957262 [Mycena belliae]
MARGHKCLSPEEKADRRRASLAKYAEKNAARLRENARLRVQRNRSALANTDNAAAIRKHKEKARAAAAKYRERNRDKIRSADSKRRERKRQQTESPPPLDTSPPCKTYAPSGQTKRPPLRSRTYTAPSSDKTCEGLEGEQAVPCSKRFSAAPEFEIRGRPETSRHYCPEGCEEFACEGCACICTASTRWVAHEHYQTEAWRAAGCP